jgi:hypothetical protein
METPKLCPTYTHVESYVDTAAATASLGPSELHGCHWPAKRGQEVAGAHGQATGERDQSGHLVYRRAA